MTKRTPLGVWCVLMALIAMSATFVYGASPVRVTQPIDENQQVRLAGNTRLEAKNPLNDHGRVSDTRDIDHILLQLQRSPKQEQALEKLIDSLNDRNSPSFHKWLTAEELGERFGVAQQDIDTVTGWLQLHGFRINQIYPATMMIDFSGNAGAIRSAFRTEMHTIEVNGETHIANMGDPWIPAALAPVVKGPVSLNDFKPQPMYKVRPDYDFAGCTNLATMPGSCYALTAGDTQTIYNLSPLFAAGYTGTGQVIAVVEDTDTYDSTGPGTEWTTYRTAFGLNNIGPAGSYVESHPGCTDPGHNADDGEAAIDVEMATTVAPNAEVELISCAGGDLTFGGLLALQGLVNGSGPYPGVVSVSYGIAEASNGNGGNAAFYNTYQAAAAEGMTVFASSGDGGPSALESGFEANDAQYGVLASLSITGWAETPYNVAVGGTDFEDVYNAKEVNTLGGASSTVPLSTYWSATNSSTYESAKSYIPEIPWNDACGSVLIAEYVNGSFTTYGTGGFCNVAAGDSTSNYMSEGGAAGGPSNCATGAEGVGAFSEGVVQPECQGYAKPSFQSGSSLSGGKAVYGQPSDGVRDIPDVSMFAANGIWGHFQTVCWNDPSYTSDGAAVCTGAPSSWSGFGGTSVASPTLAGIQALVNQKTGQTWGIGALTNYYQMAQNEYGTAGGTFTGASCNSSGSGGPASSCVFNDITQGDIAQACQGNSTVAQCYDWNTANRTNWGVTSTDVITAATVIWGGTGYTTAPTCTIAGPSNNNPYKAPSGTTLWAGGTQATCTATTTSTSTTAVWTVAFETESGLNWQGMNFIIASPTGTSPTTYTLPSCTTTASCASDLSSGFSGNSWATCSVGTGSHTNTVTCTAKTTGAAGNFMISYGTGVEFDAEVVEITNTTKGQGPNYVSGITITAGGSGYGPDTPVTLTGVGSGALAVANTSITTAASTYQPAYGAAPGWDMATGLGSVNANALTGSCSWETPAQLSATGIWNPTPSSTIAGTSANFCWNANPNATAYWLDVGPVEYGNTWWQSGPLPTTTLSQFVNNLSGSGTVWVTFWQLIGGSWSYTEYSYNGGGAGLATITSPTNGSMLSGSSQTFTWVAGLNPNITNYWIDVGSTVGGNNYFQSGALPLTTLSETVNGLPTDGSTIYVTMWSEVSAGQWLYNSYSYTAFSPASCVSTITSPAAGTELTAYSDTFGWTASTNPNCAGVVTNYWLDAGTTTSENFFYQSGPLGLVTSTTAQNLPPGYGGGQPPPNDEVQMTLWNLIAGVWVASPQVGYCGSGGSGYPGCAGPPVPVKGAPVGGKRLDSKRNR